MQVAGFGVGGGGKEVKRVVRCNTRRRLRSKFSDTNDSFDEKPILPIPEKESARPKIIEFQLFNYTVGSRDQKSFGD